MLNSFIIAMHILRGSKGRLWKNTKDRPFTLMHGVIRMVKVRYEFPMIHQNRKDLPSDNPLDRLEVLRND